MNKPLRIAQVAPPLERVPPRAYGGTERIVYELILELQRRGHEVTMFGTGDSDVPCEVVPSVPEALRPAGFGGDPSPYFYQTILDVLGREGDFDVIHSHLEWGSLMLMAATPTPVVATFHGRLDFPYAHSLLAAAQGTLVAISASQASVHPDLSWEIVHNGLSLESAPFDRRRGEGLCFVGRVNPEKGILEAIEVARLAGRDLRIAAKVGPSAVDQDYYEHVFLPAVEANSHVEYLGEIGPTERDHLFAESYATLMPGPGPEPFGLVAIESLACGTPIVARRVGALPEIIRPEIDGFFADDVQQMAFILDRVASLDRAEIRQSVLERFSASRMVDRYLQLYEDAIRAHARGADLLITTDRVMPLAAARGGSRAGSALMASGGSEHALAEGRPRADAATGGVNALRSRGLDSEPEPELRGVMDTPQQTRRDGPAAGDEAPARGAGGTSEARTEARSTAAEVGGARTA